MDHQEGINDIDGMEGGWREIERNGSGLHETEEAGSTREPLLRKRTMNTTSQIAIVGANVCTIESLDYEYFTAFLAYGSINAVLAASAAALCAYVAPAAAGSGIPEVKAYLNGVDSYSILAPSTLFVKVSAPFKILLTVAISILTSCCSYGLPWLASCTPCPPHLQEQCPTIGRSGNFKNFQCPPGHYNDLASLFLNTNDDAIRNLFSAGTDNEFHMSTLFVFFAAVYCLGLLTYGVAVPSGLFIPVILAGSTYGRMVGTLLGPISDLDAGLFALLGAASFLGGTMRMTVSVCVILLELTNDLLLLPLVMLVLLISKTVADSFNKGVYDQIVRMKGLPYMEAHAEPHMRHLVARDVVSGPPVSFSGVEKVGTILHALRLTGHNGFPVVDEPPFADAPELVGLVLRSHLLVLLKGKRFSKERVKTGVGEVLQRFGAFDFAKAGSGKGLKLEDLSILEEEMDMFVDLHPITNKSPYTVVETMSLAKAAILFRELGLRHLCVTPKTPGVRTPFFFNLYPKISHSAYNYAWFS
ncbi:hypothetical protein B296_00005775 [Ensete ventricosum]|uniref:CBS domain-containing protein n=1 Tax=Ensete ventricosum TaxID=4639 RepID=A0A426ZWG2_ENSVE|nr:hypothetical protein B296_00005775 [Ensete ventricosum]